MQEPGNVHLLYCLACPLGVYFCSQFNYSVNVKYPEIFLDRFRPHIYTKYNAHYIFLDSLHLTSPYLIKSDMSLAKDHAKNE